MTVTQRFDFPLEIQVHFKIKNIGFEKFSDKGRCRRFTSIVDGFRNYLDFFENGPPPKRIPDETKEQKRRRILREKLAQH